MDPNDRHNKEIDVYAEGITENLTVNEALILIAVCAAKERYHIGENQADDAKLITTLAITHPIFYGLEESVDPTINKFMNMIGSKMDLINPAQSAAEALNTTEKAFDQDLREVAFTWVAEIMMPDGVLSQVRKDVLDKYALLLKIDNTVLPQILVEVSG
jgi:hypothetical protein